jgi:hypothetical protein
MAREDVGIPEYPDIKNEELQKCKVKNDFLPIFYQWHWYVCQICHFIVSIERESATFRFVPPLHNAILGGLLNRCSRLMLSSLKLSNEGYYGETTLILDRCIFESATKAEQAKQLTGTSKTFIQLEHRLSIGIFREYSLMNFLKDFLQIPFSLGKGIITDCTGKQSSETDLLIYNQNLLPPILVSQDIGVFPYESVRYWFEVKTTINNAAIIDFSEKLKKFSLLIRLENYNPPFLSPPVPVLFGYGTSMTIKKIFETFESQFPGFYHQPLVAGICIIGFGYLAFCDNRSPTVGKKWLFIPADEKRYEVISLLAGILNTLAGEHLPSFGYYVMEDEHFGRGKFI